MIIGVFDVVELTDEIVELQEHEIYGKAIIRESAIMTREGQCGCYLECRGHYLGSLWCISGTTNQMGSLELQYFASANKMHNLAPKIFLEG